MCGICGYTSSHKVEEKNLCQMSDAIRHRGPDDFGLYMNADQTFGMAHRRLSIIDLDSGHQPMSNEDESVWITFNGEIYNFIELKKDLASRHVFKTTSDTEVILHLYEEFGEKCVEYLRGMFAFAIYDNNKKQLFIARDHLGQKPLYYWHSGQTFAFASEIKSLLAFDDSLRELNLSALYEYLTIRIITPPRSMFKRIQKLPPGHYLIYKNGDIKIERYWNLNYCEKHTGSFYEILDELESRIKETVRYHMISDVPVGAFLSGGLDSSLIVSMMSGFVDTPIMTFSGNVPYKNFSEIHYSRMVSERYSTQQHELRIMPSVSRILPDLIWYMDEPSDPLSVCMYYLAELTKKKVKVVLGGDGGDELFGGYDRYRGNVLVSYYAMIPKNIRRKVFEKLIGLIPEGFWYRSVSHQLKWMHQISFYDSGERYSKSLSYSYFSEGYKKNLYTDQFRKDVDLFDPEACIRSYFDSDNSKEIIDRMLYADSMTRMPDHPNMILDRMTMAHGLEARSPFLDHKLAEFCAMIPPKFKIRGNKKRYIQLELAKKYLPPALIKRKKQGFSSALPYLLADEFRSLFNIFLRDSRLVREGYLREGAVNSFLDDHLSGKRDHANRLWLLCNAEVWYRMSIEKQSIFDIRAQIEETTVRPEKIFRSGINRHFCQNRTVIVN